MTDEEHFQITQRVVAGLAGSALVAVIQLSTASELDVYLGNAVTLFSISLPLSCFFLCTSAEEHNALKRKSMIYGIGLVLIALIIVIAFGLVFWHFGRNQGLGYILGVVAVVCFMLFGATDSAK